MAISTGIVFADKPEFDNLKNKAPVSIPEHAVKVSNGVFSLGEKIDPSTGKLVEGYAFLRYKKENVKTCGNGVCELGENAKKCPEDCSDEYPDPDPDQDTSSCYTFLAKGAKWKTAEPYLVDPINIDSLNETFIIDNLAADIAKWESAAGTNIVGDKITGNVDRENIGELNGKNEVIFADIESSGAIGITIIWGIFTGPPPFRELVEWDQVYDDVDFDWSATGESDKMDFENIATHELGHSMGMGDLYESTCSEITMYGYASNGETKKRSLEAGDIVGIMELYK